jgi:chromosome segregation ATPase
MTAALLALWLTGLVPARYAESSSTDPALITGLNERVAKVETAIARLPGNDSGLSDRISAADNAMKSLGIALTALNKRSDEIATGAAQARERADAAEKAVTELRNSVRDFSKNTSVGLSAADVDIVQKRLAALEQAAKAATIDNAARLALSAAALRDAAASGAPFTRNSTKQNR